MPVITLSTVINAPPARVFDLARSIDAHQESTAATRERAVAGRLTGLIGLGEEVTWQAWHFGLPLRLTVRVTKYDRPAHFQDVMTRGAFRRMIHDHEFLEHRAGTQMLDRFEFESPFGALGRGFNLLVLTGYMYRFLERRNEALKQLAETGDWRLYLH